MQFEEIKGYIKVYTNDKSEYKQLCKCINNKGLLFEISKHVGKVYKISFMSDLDYDLDGIKDNLIKLFSHLYENNLKFKVKLFCDNYEILIINEEIIFDKEIIFYPTNSNQEIIICDFNYQYKKYNFENSIKINNSIINYDIKKLFKKLSVEDLKYYKPILYKEEYILLCLTHDDISRESITECNRLLILIRDFLIE